LFIQRFMANIPSDKPQLPIHSSQQANFLKPPSEISSISQSILFPDGPQTKSSASLSHFTSNDDPSKTTKKTSQIANVYFFPRDILSLRSLAIYGQNKPPNDFELKESFLKTLTLDRSDPKLKALQRNLIHSIKNPEILKEILSDLIDRNFLEDISCFFQSKRTRALLFEVLPSKEVEQKIFSPELQDILINLIQHTPEEEITVEIFEELSKKYFFLSFEMFKKMDDPEKLEIFIPFLDQIAPPQYFYNFIIIALENDHLNAFHTLVENTPKELLNPPKIYFELLCDKIPKETKLKLWSFLINSIYRTFSLIEVEKFRNASLDIGEEFSDKLQSGTIPWRFFLFTVSTFFPAIREKILSDKPPSEILISANEIQEGLETMGPSKRLFNKIESLLSYPLDRLKQLKPLKKEHLSQLPSIRAKHAQESGSCAIKNLNSLLSMSFDAPSVVISGGWPGYKVDTKEFLGHAVYAEVFKGEDDQYFVLVHNLGWSCQMHERSEDKKIFPLPLFFESFAQLEHFAKAFYGNNQSDYEACLKSAPKLTPGDLKNFGPETINKKIAATLLDRPKKPRPNEVYKLFRSQQKELLEKLTKTMSSQTSLEVTRAIEKRKVKKKRR